MVLGVDRQRGGSARPQEVETKPHDLAESIGRFINGKVRNLTGSAFVEVEDIDGLIHISDMSWSKRIKHHRKC
jgi:ribosomal protein S1